MPFAMLYPPSMAALPDVTSPYPHFCDFSRPRFTENPTRWPQESESRQRRTTSSSPGLTATSNALPPTRKRRILANKRPKTPHPDRIRPRPQERTPLSQYVIAALAGCAQYGAAFPVPTTVNGHMNSPVTSSPNYRPRDEYRRASPRAATPVTRTTQSTISPSSTRFTEQLPRQEERSEELQSESKGRKRENLKKCGRKIGSWIVTLCIGRKKNRTEETRVTTTQRVEEEMVSEKQESVPRREALGDGENKEPKGVEGKRISSASEVTLVAMEPEGGDEIHVQGVIPQVRGGGGGGGGGGNHVRVSPGRVYIGH